MKLAPLKKTHNVLAIISSRLPEVAAVMCTGNSHVRVQSGRQAGRQAGS